MVIDTSAICAILFDEPEKARFSRLIEAAQIRLISAATRVEVGFVMEGRHSQLGRLNLERFLLLADPVIVPLTPHHAELAMAAFRRYGKGRHIAGLNIGDCFAYALSTATGEPLLFKGHGFIHTDIRQAA